MAEPQPEPLSMAECLNTQTSPVFVRKVGRPRLWIQALAEQDASLIAGDFDPPSGGISLWYIETDRDLRRVAVAMNEGRDAPHEKLDLITIRPDDLAEAGIQPVQTPGRSACPEAVRRHYDAVMDQTQRALLCDILVTTERRPGRCTRGKMKTAVALSRQEGCFAVRTESDTCGCGASR